MQKIGFFTPISFGNQPKSHTQWALEKVDSYFHLDGLGGKAARVIFGTAQQSRKEVILTKNTYNFFTFQNITKTVLKIASYALPLFSKLPKPLRALPIILFIAKATLRYFHTFHIIDAKERLEEGIDISPELAEKIYSVWSKSPAGEKDPEIKIFSPSFDNKDFLIRLHIVPNLVFRTAINDIDSGRYHRDILEQHFKNIVEAKEVCLIKGLDHLVIPPIKRFVVNETPFIVSIAISRSNPWAQKELYETSTTEELKKPVEQLAEFIAETGFSGVKYINTPLIEGRNGKQIALVNLGEEPDTIFKLKNKEVVLAKPDKREGAALGIFGCRLFTPLSSTGLINYLSHEKLIDLVLDIAKRYNLRYEYPTREGYKEICMQEIKKSRMQDIEDIHQLKKFYEKTGAANNPRKRIEVEDLNTLGLNLDEEEILKFSLETPIKRETLYRYEMTTLKEAIVYVINYVNERLEKPLTENETVEQHRSIVLKGDPSPNGDETLYNYAQLGLRKEIKLLPQDNRDQAWIGRILHALLTHRHIFSYSFYGEDTIYVQT